MATRGFLPCLAQYKHTHFPIEKLYESDVNVDKVKKLLSALVDSKSLLDIKQQGVGGDIQPIRPNSKEGQRLINLFEFPNNLFRIDYGKNTFRLILGLSNEDKIAYILAFDTEHTTYRQA